MISIQILAPNVLRVFTQKQMENKNVKSVIIRIWIFVENQFFGYKWDFIDLRRSLTNYTIVIITIIIV
jgi:hypothetical protein